MLARVSCGRYGKSDSGEKTQGPSTALGFACASVGMTDLVRVCISDAS